MRPTSLHAGVHASHLEYSVVLVTDPIQNLGRQTGSAIKNLNCRATSRNIFVFSQYCYNSIFYTFFLSTLLFILFLRCWVYYFYFLTYFIYAICFELCSYSNNDHFLFRLYSWGIDPGWTFSFHSYAKTGRGMATG